MNVKQAGKQIAAGKGFRKRLWVNLLPLGQDQKIRPGPKT